MGTAPSNFLTKLVWSLPWLTRYPMWRLEELFRRMSETISHKHLIFVVANHFEPGWDGSGIAMDWDSQIARVDKWTGRARTLGDSFKDSDGAPFRYTYFYPIEQYHKGLLDRLAEFQMEGFGEVEIHLHHGLDGPDTAQNLRYTLELYRDILAEEHGLLSKAPDSREPKYAFVHGNLALANSAGGRYCGVDSEMQILADTGCYADFTLPSWPDRSQVGHINAIYQCARPLNERSPHTAGRDLRVGESVKLPVLFTGPLLFDWRRRIYGLPIPRVDGGALASNYPPEIARLNNWLSANIGIKGRPEWVFIKLYCHAFLPFDEDILTGESMRRFLGMLLDTAAREGFGIHFVTAREAFNIALAAIEGKEGDPGYYRDYSLLPTTGGRKYPAAAANRSADVMNATRGLLI